MEQGFDDDLSEEKFVEATELTIEQYAKFLDEIEKIPTNKAPISGQVTRLCFEFMEDTGCRVTETTYVKKKDLNFNSRILTVTHPKVDTRCKCSRWKNKNEYSRIKILDYADPNCDRCHGMGKYKKPQRTTFTPRIVRRLVSYCSELKDDDYLFPVSRQRLWKWSKKAGRQANINIFQQKKERYIEGIFTYLMRSLCTRRMKKDGADRELRMLKLRHSFSKDVHDVYEVPDINALLNWEARTYHV